MFTTGFEKTAGFAGTVGGLVGKFRGGAQARLGRAVTAIKKPFKEFGSEYSAQKRLQMKSPEYQAATAKRQTQPLTEAASKKLSPEHQAKVQKRLERYQAHKKGQKPSFAMKHPYLTAGGAFLAGKYVFGDKEKEQPAPPPSLVYPQY